MSTKKPSHGWTVIVWDADPDRRSRVLQVLLALGMEARIVDIETFEPSALRSASFCLAAVGAGRESSIRPRALEVIRGLKQLGCKVASYEDGVDSWPIRIRCLPLMAGAAEVLDSGSAAFADAFRQWLERTVNSEAKRRTEEESIRVTMRQIGVVGDSPVMLEVFRKALRVSALSDLPVLITGETGTGKERLACAIHRLDPKRRHHPFVAVNCAAISPLLAESELFGHSRGAFTGAERERKGWFRSANNGVLFLDEIGELSDTLQAKLLRVLQEGRVLGVGEEQEHMVNVRVVAATNRDLKQSVEARKFRADLYHRLNVLTIHLPPLRERPQDITPLIEFFLGKHQALKPSGAVSVDLGVVEALSQLELPGNVRQLENLVRQALLSKESDGALHLSDLPSEVWQQLSANVQDPFRQSNPGSAADSIPGGVVEDSRIEILPHLKRLLDLNGGSLSRSLRWCERALVEAALQRTNGNQSETARLLGITPRSVYNKLRKHRLA